MTAGGKKTYEAVLEGLLTSKQVGKMIGSTDHIDL